MREGIDALVRLLDLLFRELGADRTMRWLVIAFAGAAAWRFYQNWRQDRYFRKALDEKERTIERLAGQERQWRIYFMNKQGGMSLPRARQIVEEGGRERKERK